jgi:Tetratricopeptide repeat./Transglutaminase-like superfamily.
MMFMLQKNAYKDNKAALKVYEDYVAKNYNYAILNSLSDLYFEQGMPEKGLKILEDLHRMFPWDPDMVVNLVRYYFDKQDYKQALTYAEKALLLAPYTPEYHENLGLVYEQLGKKEEAVKAYTQALYYDHNRFDTRYKIRSFQNKPDIYKAFPQSDPYELIKNAKDPKEGDYNFYYVLDEKFDIVYPEGATEEYVTLIVKVLTQKGIDSWKEMYIPYDQSGQSLNIEKAEVVKKNGNRVPAEKNGNELVFTGLETGDAILVRFKTQDYYVGRLAREFWNKFTISAFVPTNMARYCLLAANNISIHHKVSDNRLQPSVSEFENFKLYTWEQKDIPALKEEPLMPNLQDVGTIVHVSTMKSWDEVARWYSDLVTLALEDDYEVKEKYAELFPAGKTYTQREKAMIIYNYIVSNISYSSVPFRQSAFVPQKPSKTINTRLGDCKDLSALFVSLARMAGLNARLLLVDTRDEGQKQMLLPMIEFNHCIVKVTLDGKEHYLELTDNNLPFGSLPNNINNALSLEIPYKDEKISGAELKPIKAAHRTRDKAKRTMRIAISGSDLQVETNVVKTGALTSSVRDRYKTLSAEKQKEEMEKTIGNNFKNPVKVERISFSGLDRLDDSVGYEYAYTVSNEVVELGEMGMIKVPYTDLIATIENFTLDKRQFPIEYWAYENTDEYETIVHVKAPAGKQFFEIPKDETVSFKNSRYSIQFIREKPDEVTIVRKATLVRENILPADYAAFKEFLSRIVKVEAKYVGFK